MGRARCHLRKRQVLPRLHNGLHQGQRTNVARKHRSRTPSVRHARQAVQKDYQGNHKRGTAQLPLVAVALGGLAPELAKLVRQLGILRQRGRPGLVGQGVCEAPAP